MSLSLIYVILIFRFNIIALLLLEVMHKEHNSNMPFSILATLVRLHIMNYVAISAIIEAYKIKRKRNQKNNEFKEPPKIYQPPALQTKMEM